MAMNEGQLKSDLAAGLKPVYVLYGEESYLVEQYMRLIVKRTLDGVDDAFHLHRFDGGALTLDRLADATASLPMLTEQVCVTVRDMDLAAAEEGLVPLLAQLPDTCVLVLWQMTVNPDRRKGWSRVFEAAAASGCVVNFARKTPADVVKLLVGGAKRRGCVLSPDNARVLLEQVGNDLNLLLCELDKLVAVADGGEITRALIEQLATKNLETRVFDLSKALLAGRVDQALGLLHRLFQQREEPVSILAVLSNAYADVYRAKVAVAAGESAASLATDIKSYKGKEFRLRNATAQASRMSTQTLRACLELLAQADMTLKSGHGDGHSILEQTVCALAQQQR